MHKLLVTLCLVVMSCATAPKPAPTPAPAAAPAAPAAPKSLYDRLGGKPAVEAVIDDFLGRVAADERINAFFAGAHLPRLRKRLIEQVCAASGGGCTYSGRDMKTVHAGMGITGAHWDAIAGDLVATLEKFKVPEKEKGELLGAIVPMRAAIVEEP